MSTPVILTLDQGTTSTRAILFDAAGSEIASASRSLVQHYPGDGCVEHDAREIITASKAVLREALDRGGR